MSVIEADGRRGDHVLVAVARIEMYVADLDCVFRSKLARHSELAPAGGHSEKPKARRSRSISGRAKRPMLAAAIDDH